MLPKFHDEANRLGGYDSGPLVIQNHGDPNEIRDYGGQGVCADSPRKVFFLELIQLQQLVRHRGVLFGARIKFQHLEQNGIDSPIKGSWLGFSLLEHGFSLVGSHYRRSYFCDMFLTVVHLECNVRLRFKNFRILTNIQHEYLRAIVLTRNIERPVISSIAVVVRPLRQLYQNTDKHVYRGNGTNNRLAVGETPNLSQSEV
jgi:hypothetical protein